MTPAQRRQAARSLADVLDLLDAGALDATAAERTFIAGALAALTAEEPTLTD